MSIWITGERSELGRLLSPQRAPAQVRINIAGQNANTLLHDGHAWKGFARTALAGVRRALRERRQPARARELRVRRRPSDAGSVALDRRDDP